MSANLEIERKYLIRMPDEAQLAAMPGCKLWEIVQTYLCDGEDGSTRRVRSIKCGDSIRYVQTIKHRKNALASHEQEWELSCAEYEELLAAANPALNPIIKQRYRIPYCGELLEVDLYSFWQDRATLEIELESEEQEVFLPPWLKIVRELTGDPAYKNRFLAERIPMEDMDPE